MNKIITIFLAIILITGTMANSCSAAQDDVRHAKMKKEFEQRLNLTDKQKEKAKALHKKGREEMKPIIYKIELDRQEIEQLKQTSMPEKTKQEKLNTLNEDVKKLEKQATEIRKKNSQEFEKILNKKQKEELAKMKAEGRARFEKNHPPRPMFGGMGAPNLMFSRPFGAPSSKN